MAYSVIRSPARLCSRDGKFCYYGRLEYDFLAFCCALLPTFLMFSFLIPVCSSSSCSFVCAAVICYSQQVRVRSTCSFLCRLFPASFLGILLFYSFTWQYFFAVLISPVAFWLCSRTRYVSTWFAYLDNFSTLVLFLCLTLCDHII